MPSLRAVLMIRQAISPRLAISNFWNMNGYHPGDVEGGTPSRGPMIGAKAGRTIGDVEPQPRQRPAARDPEKRRARGRAGNVRRRGLRPPPSPPAAGCRRDADRVRD